MTDKDAIKAVREALLCAEASVVAYCNKHRRLLESHPEHHIIKKAQRELYALEAKGGSIKQNTSHLSQTELCKVDNKQDTTMPDEIWLGVETCTVSPEICFMNDGEGICYVRADLKTTPDVEGLKKDCMNWFCDVQEKSLLDHFDEILLILLYIDRLNSQGYLTTPAPETRWQTIDSAPKDKRILVYTRKWSAPQHAQWYGTFWSINYDLGAWKDAPTHWMPLPQPPKDKE